MFLADHSSSYLSNLSYTEVVSSICLVGSERLSLLQFVLFRNRRRIMVEHNVEAPLFPHTTEGSWVTYKLDPKFLEVLK